MAIQTINLGSVANDGTGDDLREAFEKVIFNFNDLDNRSPEATTVLNLGTGEGLFSNKNNAELQFKSLVAGNNVTLSSDSNELTLDVNAGVTQFDIAADSGSVTITEGSTVTIAGGTLITTARNGNTITIDSSALSKVEDDPAPKLAAGLNADGNNLGNVGLINATTVTANFNGNLTGNVHGIDIRDLNYNRDPDNWDFSGIAPTSVTNLWDFLFATTKVDFGTISGNNVNVSLDFGTINI
ncbi:hypothetical protein N9D61_02175 [Planktomarina sp.]|jgi:hypothetical protein|nr:hypothetical protein [Planktomarina sp.]